MKPYLKPSLGTFIGGGRALIDLPRLLETRLLLTANSGQGKSRALRCLLEQTAGLVQQIVIDPEGEFASLREKHDLIICAAQGGDVAAHPRTAALLARKLRETQVSAVLDLSELRAHERHSFVRLFLEALVECPRSLWAPCIVAIDECQIFAPERGQAESEATAAVIDATTRGRKRGLCLVAATLRISMLHKAVAAELKNRLIGGTVQDLDVKRLAFDLGMSPKDALAVLRCLEPGHFLAYGPALGLKEPRELITGDVLTTHPEVGKRGPTAPPNPTAAILAMLPKLGDLPKEAETEARTLEELRRELAAARREATVAKNAKPRDPVADTEVLSRAEQRGYDRAVAAVAAASKEAKKARDALLRELEVAISGSVRQQFAQALSKEFTGAADKLLATKTIAPKPSSDPAWRRPSSQGVVPNGHAAPAANLGKCERAILAVLAQFPEGCAMGKLTLLAGYRESGGFRNSLSALRTQGLIEGGNTGMMRITPDGDAQGPFPALPRGAELLRYWLEHPSFGKCERAILQALSDGAGMTMGELTSATGYEESGGFRNSLSALRTAGVLVGRNTGTMRLAETLLS